MGHRILIRKVYQYPLKFWKKHLSPQIWCCWRHILMDQKVQKHPWNFEKKIPLHLNEWCFSIIRIFFLSTRNRGLVVPNPKEPDRPPGPSGQRSRSFLLVECRGTTPRGGSGWEVRRGRGGEPRGRKAEVSGTEEWDRLVEIDKM